MRWSRCVASAPQARWRLIFRWTLSAVRDWARFPGYQFGLADEEPGEATRIDLSDLPAAADQGKASFPLSVDEVPSTTPPVKAAVAIRMREPGGRPVEPHPHLGLLP